MYLNWNVHTIFMETREYQSKSNNNFCSFAAMHKQFIFVTDISFIVYISIFKWESAISTQLISTYIIIEKLGGIYKMEICRYVNSNSKIIQHNIMYVASLHNKAEGL